MWWERRRRHSICPLLPLHNPSDWVMLLWLPVSSSSSTSIRGWAVLHAYLEKRHNWLSVLGMATRKNLKNKSRWVSGDWPLEDISNVYHAAQQESNLPLSRMPLCVSVALNTYNLSSSTLLHEVSKTRHQYFYNSPSGSYAKAGQKWWPIHQVMPFNGDTLRSRYCRKTWRTWIRVQLPFR